MIRPSSLFGERKNGSAADDSATPAVDGVHRIGLCSLILIVLLFSSCGGGLSAPSRTAPSSDAAGHATGTTMTNLQAKAGWQGFGELAPDYVPCSSCRPQVTWKMTQTSTAAQFDIGGTVPYSDVLWSDAVIGQGSTQGVPDSNETLVPTLNNFTYDAWFMSHSLPASQVLEFDVSQ